MEASSPDIAHLHRPRFNQKFSQHMGLHLDSWLPERVVLTLDIEDHHLNPAGMVHGGVLMSLLDTAATLSGCYAPTLEERKGAMTLSMTTSFISAVTHGKISAIGRKRGGGKSIYMSTAELFDQNQNLIAIGEATLRYRKSEIQRR